MTLIYKALKLNNDDIIEVDKQDKEFINIPLSTNLEQIRNEIKSYINQHPDKMLVANPVRYMINSTSENELIETMKKEVKSLKLINKIIDFEVMDELKQDERDYGIDFGLLKPLHGYIIKDINLNTIKFCQLLDELAQVFDDVYLIKCMTDDPYTERVVLLISERTSDESIKENPSLPINQESFINFLYAIYANGLYVLKASEEEYKKIVAQNVKLFKGLI